MEKKYNKPSSANHSNWGNKSGSGRVSPNYFKLLIYALIAISVIAAVLITVTRNKSDINYAELLNTALGNTFNCETYRYTSESKMHIGAEEKYFSAIEGVRAGASARQLKGDILGRAIEIIYLDGKIYRKDASDAAWRLLGVGELSDAANLINELEPVNNFRFETVGEITVIGKEKIDGKSCVIIEFYPTIADKWIPRYFKEIKYTVWITPNNPYILKATVSAISVENETAGLNISMSFSDFNSKIIITAPIE